MFSGRPLHAWSVALAAMIAASLVFAPAALAQPVRGGGPKEDPTDERVQKEKRQAQAQKHFDEGQRLLAKGDILRAKTKFKSAFELAGQEGVGPAAISALMQIHSQGMRELEAAKSAYDEGAYLLAIREARRIKHVYANLFGGVPGASGAANLSRMAADLIARIENNPDAEPALEEEKAEPLAKKIERLEKQCPKDRSLYYDLYQTSQKAARKYPRSPTGQTAAKRIKELKADKEIWPLIGMEKERRELASALSRIEALEKTGEKDEAKKALEKLLIRHPGKTRADLEKRAKEKAK